VLALVFPIPIRAITLTWSGAVVTRTVRVAAPHHTHPARIAHARIAMMILPNRTSKSDYPEDTLSFPLTEKWGAGAMHTPSLLLLPLQLYDCTIERLND
jgi:hypothetical protein